MGIYNEREKVNAIDDRTQPTEFGHQLARESNNNDLAEERISSGTEESESYRKQQAVHDGSQDIVIRDDSEQQAIEVEVTKEARQPKEMTKIQLVNLWIMMVYMGSQLTLPFALAVFLVRDIYKDGDHSEQKIAQLTGFLAAAQSAARSMTALPWGMASDIVGRKVVILVGILASMLSLLSFGSSHTYVGAVLARFIPSLLVGTPVALKSMMGDSCDSIGQAKAMTIFSLGHGLGSVVGPVLGGILSYPCDNFNLPGCSAQGIFRVRPFFLPCLVISCLGIIAIMSTSILMKETQPDVLLQPGGWMGNLIRVLTFQSKKYSAIDSDDNKEEGIEQDKRKQDVEMGNAHLMRKDTANETFVEDKGKNGVPTEEIPAEPFKWYKDSGVRLALIGSGLIALIYNFVDELSPIFISAPFDRGGLSMALEEFTWPLACSGIALAIFALCLYHRLVKWIGATRLCRYGLLGGVIPALLLPTASLFTSNKMIALIFVYAAMIFRGPAKICALNSSMIIVNRVAGKKTMGRVNGAAMTLQSGGRALGPLLSGTIWAISVSLNIPFQQYLGFILVGIALLCTQILYIGLQLPPES